MEKTTVLIVDSQSIFRAGVRKALAQHLGLDRLEIVDCDPADGIESVRRTVEHSSPDVVLLDVDGSEPGGFEICSDLRRLFPSTGVVMLSPNPNADELMEAMKTGASAYLGKDSTVEELSEAIQSAAAGEYAINEEVQERPGLASRVLDRFEDLSAQDMPEEAMVPGLSPREMRFLNLIAEDNSNRQIAAILGIDEHTIKSYVSTILKKLNAGERAHATMMELCSNWLAIQQESASLTSPEQSKERGDASAPAKGTAKTPTKTAAKSRRNGNKSRSTTSGSKKKG